MANDIIPTKPKAILRTILFGTAVVWVYALLAPILVGLLDVLAIEIPVVGITLGGAIAAGVAASLVDYVFRNYYPK